MGLLNQELVRIESLCEVLHRQTSLPLMKGLSRCFRLVDCLPELCHPASHLSLVASFWLIQSQSFLLEDEALCLCGTLISMTKRSFQQRRFIPFEEWKGPYRLCNVLTAPAVSENTNTHPFSASPIYLCTDWYCT